MLLNPLQLVNLKDVLPDVLLAAVVLVAVVYIVSAGLVLIVCTVAVDVVVACVVVVNVVTAVVVLVL